MGKPKDGGVSAFWDANDILIFCDICIEEIELGNRPTTHFSRDGWVNVTTKFQERTGKKYDKVQMKNKWDHLKKEWKIWSDLKRGMTGLGWNPTTKTIDASDQWWHDRLLVVPAARKFRYAGIAPELEDRMRRMFDSVVARGRNAITPSVRNQEVESIDERDVSVEEGAAHEDVQEQGVPPAPAEVTSKRKRKKGKNTTSTSVLEDIAESSKTISRCLEVRCARRADKGESPYTITQALERLRSYPEVIAEKKLYNFSISYLLDRAHREAFMFLPEGENINWLQNCFTSGD